MKEEIKINNDYLEAFNLGYELAMELNLKSPMFKNFSSDNSKMSAMQKGLDEYINETLKSNAIKASETLNFDTSSQNKTKLESEKGQQGFDVSL